MTAAPGGLRGPALGGSLRVPRVVGPDGPYGPATEGTSGGQSESCSLQSHLSEKGLSAASHAAGKEEI